MRRWFEVFPSVLRAPDREPQGGGSDTHRVVDPGAEVELGDPDEPDEPAGGKKTAADIEIEQLRQRLKDADDDAKFWADRAKRPAVAAPAPAPARAAEPEPARRREPDAPAEKPEDLIDDLNKRGLVALKDRGYITKDDLREALETAAATTDERISEARSEAEFSGRLASEFPEMMEDSARAAKGLAPKSELFVKAGEIYRGYVDLDPNLKGSRGLLLIAARQARQEIDGKGKGGKGGKGGNDVDESDIPPSQRRRQAETGGGDRQQQRRDRIERQTPSRGNDDGEESGEGEDMTATQLEIAKRLKVTPEQFRKESKKLAAGGGGRRGRN